ncbi:MAG: S-layer homology domain-containing protein, partial [Oscillospiraceae bacterium]
LNDQKGLLVSDAEVADAASKTVNVGLTLDAENVTSNPPADKNKAEAAAKGGDIGAFFDISVTKTTEVTSSDGAKSTATEKVPELPVAVPVTLAIPAEIQGHAYYNVIRVHNGVAERIPATATETTVSFLSSLYSTYAIAYSDDPIFMDDTPAVNEDTNGGNTGGSTSGGSGGAAVQPVTGGSVTTSPKNPKPGDKVTITVDPDKGYKVDTVKVLDKNGKEVAVTKNGDGTYTYIQPKGTVTIDATFKKDGAGAQVGPFTDVTSDQWFAEAVEFVYNEKLFNGVAPDKFGPQITTTRGMFVTILGRLAKIDVTKWTAQSKFPDVHTDMYCAPYIAWGEDQGIVLGFDDGSYRPDDLVTREQMAAILYRYVQKTGTLDLAKTHELTYADKADIADWA